MDPFPNQDLSGQSLLHYQVNERLGAGGMGVVYRAVDLKLRRTVALKFLLDSHSVSEDVKQRFMREAMASSALEHTNIGTLHAIEESGDGKLFLVMACYDGPTLGSRMASGPLGVEEAVSIALQLLHGLDEAHKHGIVHRDIKPGNIIFNSRGVLKILDFGLAKLHGSPDLTQPGMAMGTMAYMAPEQATGAGADQRADLWSAGVVLYEMIAGRRLFQGADIVSVLYAVMSKEAPPLEGVTPAIARVLRKALQKDANLRYQSAKAMIEDLEAAQVSPSQQEVWAEAAETLAPGALQGSLQEIAAGAASDVTQLAQPERLTGTKEARRSWKMAGLIALLIVLVLASLGTWLRMRRVQAPSSGIRIAVLPLTASADSPAEAASVQAVGDGLRLELIRSLASLEAVNPGLLVVPSSQLAAQHVTDPSTARSALGVGRVLSGSFTEAGGKVHVVLSSVDTADSKVLGLEQIDGNASNLPALEQELVSRSTKMLRLKSASQAAMGERATDLPADQAKTYLASMGYLDRWDKPGNLDAAIQGLTAVVGASPRFALGYAALANCYLRQYQATKDAHALELAGQNAAMAEQLDRSHAEIPLALGQVRTFQGKYLEAVSQFQQALASDPRSDGAYRGLAKAYAAMGLPDKAEQEWHKAIELRPNSVDGYNQLAIFTMSRGDYAGAAADFHKASALAPDNAAILGNLGAALASAGSLAESRDALQRSIRLAPSAPAWNNLGDLDLKQQHYADAAADYEKALEFNKANYRVWSNMAAAYARTPGEKDKSKDAFLHAAQMCREALKTNPNDPVTLSDLAMFLASEGGERQEPLELIERALALAPEDTYVQFNAAETYEALGYRKEALDWVEKLLAAGYPMDDVTDSPMLADLIKDTRFQAISKTQVKRPAAGQ